MGAEQQHWNSTSRFVERFPNVKVESDRIFVKDDNIYTSAGVTASMDLALALIEEDHGRKVALRVAKELIFLKRPGGQSQFSIHLSAQASEASPFRDIHSWILENLREDLSIHAMSTRLGMSRRNFSRLFKRETKMTPGDYVEAARVEAARRILEDSDLYLKQIAQMCGFADPSGLRRAFMLHMKMSPAEYRKRFRSNTISDAFPKKSMRVSKQLNQSNKFADRQAADH